jgi:hypothetical protein
LILNQAKRCLDDRQARRREREAIYGNSMETSAMDS